MGSAEDTQLTDESQVQFLVQGVKARFATVHSRMSFYAGGLSDEIFFDTRLRNAYDPDFREIDLGLISFDNAMNTLGFRLVGELRFLSNDLLKRIDQVSFQDPALEKEAGFAGLFYGALAPYFMATYYGRTEREGGGVISQDPASPGPFIPSEEMYEIAVARLGKAAEFADAYHARVIKTLVARIELFRGRRTEARSAAKSGLVEGDPAFESEHGVDHDNLWFVQNQWYAQAGAGIHQWAVDYRFRNMVESDPAEAFRIPLVESQGVDSPPTIFYIQNRYPAPNAPIPFATWQENELILAELDLNNDDSAAALSRINRVRASHGLGGLSSGDTETLIREREIELWTMGLRLVDQRRFDLWHLGTGTWQYLPIPQSERNINENL